MHTDRVMAVGFALGMAALTSSADAQVFKCTDGDGKVTYTDVPCLRSETSALVDTRANVADSSSLRKAAESLRHAASAPASRGESTAGSPTPSPPPRTLKSFVRPSGY